MDVLFSFVFSYVFLCLSRRKDQSAIIKRKEEQKGTWLYWHLIYLSKICNMRKAAVISSVKEPLEIKQVPIPKVGPNDILVKNTACGVCHSDLHLAKGGKILNIK